VSALRLLYRLLEERDPWSTGHSSRVAALAEDLARSLGWGEPELRLLRLGSRLHDVGKLAVPVCVLCKPGPLAPKERAQIRVHPTAGAQLLAPVEELRPILPCVLYHHERWDGGGYPAGRSRTEIPIEARILAVVDAFDAMTSARPYRDALPEWRALAEVARCAGSQFDPDLAGAFVSAFSRRAAASF
jgi:HD-GYP domain-containing protein (c-di-GMP phosphodiesterase class II)